MLRADMPELMSKRLGCLSGLDVASHTNDAVIEASVTVRAATVATLQCEPVALNQGGQPVP